MELGQAPLALLDFVMGETALFAATGFLLLGVSDLLIDAFWLCRMLCLGRAWTPENLPEPQHPGSIAVFTPAWDEADVIGSMLRHTLRSFDHADYRL